MWRRLYVLPRLLPIHTCISHFSKTGSERLCQDCEVRTSARLMQLRVDHRHKPGRHWHMLTSYPASARMKHRLLFGPLVTKAAELYSSPCCRKTTGFLALKQHLTC